jgi:predicted Rossmann fold nucleotide-binding protein DprA/Smf involved in DNA uptake
VVVIEAPERSGALITADFALEQGRDLFVHSGLLQSRLNGGCRKMAFDGAPGLANAGELLEDWGLKAAGESRIHTGRIGSPELLKKEIQGELVTYAGEHFER